MGVIFRQFWTRMLHVAVMTAGFLITVMEPEIPLVESIKALSGIDWMGWVIAIAPAFSSPTQVKEVFLSVKKKVVA